MNPESCFQLGYIIKPHGLQGDLSIFLDTDQPEAYQTMESVFVQIKQKLVPFSIDHLQIRGNRAIVGFDNVNNIEEAEKLKGNLLFLPLDMLPPLPPDQFYYHEVIDYTIIDESGQKIGRITQVFETSGNDLFAVDHRGHEVLIPVQDDFIVRVDHEKNEIHMRLPDGLLDVYLN
ncbi:MAG: 16S rRNA processing protein RimM [Cyclobacteriaceae bacterium]|nr:16S rRNA processing protein RimM [Cyclobacteriaceae bacterium]